MAGTAPISKLGYRARTCLCMPYVEWVMLCAFLELARDQALLITTYYEVFISC